jgi:hypothetical protein
VFPILEMTQTAVACAWPPVLVGLFNTTTTTNIRTMLGLTIESKLQLVHTSGKHGPTNYIMTSHGMDWMYIVCMHVSMYIIYVH